MDDWSTLIYVILGIAAFIFSARKGKKQNTQGQQGQVQKKSTLENILSQQLPPEWIEAAQKQEQAQQNQIEENREIVDEMGISAEEEGSVSTPNLEPILKYKKEKEKEDKSKTKKKKSKFDAKKAVIYSSILNRKY